MRITKCLLVALAVLALGALAFGQDPVKVDPKHYKVEMENAQVRVLRVHYGPHEKSVMHFHPASIAVFVTDANGRFTFADGKTQDMTNKMGQTMTVDAGTHLPENTSDKPFEVIVVELKGQTTAPVAKPAAPAKGAAAKK